MVTRNREIVGSWRSVHASCETSRSACSAVGGGTSSASLVRSTSATPLGETGTEIERRSAGR